MTTLPYHIRRDENDYSLAFVNTDPEAVDDYIDRQPERTKALARRFTVNSQSLYAAYTVPIVDTRVIGTTGFDDPLVLALLTTHRGVLDGTTIESHKPYQLDKAAAAFDRVQWRQSVPAVAADLLSNAVLGHALPNTNHRSSVAFVGLYLSQYDETFNLPDELRTSDPPAWVVDYFHESKRLLTVRRNAGIFRWLADRGVTTLERKHGVLIDCDDYDLHADDPYTHFANRHRERTRTFIDRLLDATETDIDESMLDKGRSVFEARIC